MRKRGAAPQGGGAGRRPAKQSRREGRSKPVDHEFYEVEDSDPDEVKHAERFDKVDNYEYELPSDFEDEEIDEELAFTEEDKKKFGDWFEEEVSTDEDGRVLFGDDDVDDLTDAAQGDEGEEENDGDGDADGWQGRGAAETLGQRDGSDFLLDEEEDDDLDGLGDEDGEGEDAEIDVGGARYRAMLREVLGDEAAARRRARRDPNAAVVSEAYPESEYSLNPGAASAGGFAAGTLSIADLIQGLTGEERRQLGAARRLLDKVAGARGGEGKGAGGKGLRPVSVPLPAVVAARQERKAGYAAAAKEVSRWQSIVKANREVPTLRLVSGREQVPRVTNTAALVAQHTASADNALEAEVAALLQAAGVANTEAIEEAEEKMALKALSLEEAKERRDRLAKLRALLFYHELKSRRLKAIKSKEYHRHLARAAKHKATKLAAAAAEGDGNVDAERAAAIEAEFQRAKERLTLRHRNSTRWARRALKRGQVQLDAGTKAALAEQLQLGEQLKRKIEGQKGNGNGSDDGSTSASDSEEDRSGDGKSAPRSWGDGRVRSAALELLADGNIVDLGGENAPKKGLLALPFMKRAMERRRLAAKEEAEQLLRELDEQQLLQQRQDDNDEGQDEGGREFLGKQDATDMKLPESVVGYSVPVSSPAAAALTNGGRRKFGGGTAAAAPPVAVADDGGPEVSDMDSDDAEDAEAKAERLGRPPAVAAAVAAAKQHATVKGKKVLPPTAADEVELDAAIAAGAAGCGLLVSSSDVGVDLAAIRQGSGSGTVVIDDADAERQASGATASTRAAAPPAGGSTAILKRVAAHQASLAAGGGRAALFESTTATAGGGSEAAVGTAASALNPKFARVKKFEGARPGYCFKKGPQGLGYYLDAKAAAVAVLDAVGDVGGRTGKSRGKQQQKCGKGSEVTVAGEPTQEPKKQQGCQAAQQQKGPKGAQQLQKQQEQQKRGSGGGPLGDSCGQEDEEEENAPIMRPAGADQRDLIRQAFAGDDVEAAFAEEKAAAVAEELPDVDEPSIIPGWGAWASNQRNPGWMKAAKEKAAKSREEAVKGRKDANLKYVMISEKWDKKSIKYTAPSAPFPFTSQEAYERSIRQPLGREYNADTAFRDLTRPAVLKQAGVPIAPLRFSESLAKDLTKNGKKAKLEREARRVVTVAGGSVRRGKK
ncbi:hypothetical protein VaNZ11_013698 [Volvox africanus]|uniref:Uncharacterized protein n=1 Tax=Volvox africanus TaxID=51714 RepID=A0ABQ5SIW4_9CHLO|nr:hypothetical protein VaNZ11_013698 [Volvox africanus]